MAKSVVSIAHCNNYEADTITHSLQDVLGPLGGIESFVKPSDSVLLKVNLLRSATPDKAVTTHPALVEATIKAVRAAGGIPIVGDSPGGPNSASMVKKIIETTELGEVCARTGTELVIFDADTVRIKSTAGKLYTSFNVGRVVRDADVIIGMPKLKTHGFQRFTGAVKVFFGVIPGLEKAQYHLKVPGRMDFAEMLLDVYLAVKPHLSIMDAVVAMEGDGPAGGTPRYVGALMASTDAVAMDFVASAAIGIEPLDVYTNLAARDRGLLGGMDDIEIIGAQLADIRIGDFKFATGDMADRIPGRFLEFFKDLATSKPYLAAVETCTGCATCEQSCPSDAIDFSAGKPRFDYSACIRCYCCEELCPELAVKRKNHWIVRPFLRGRR
ncbi:MAG: DUF362 domain-containing protein [Candidatus Aquicultor sp.]|nr:DUF362 domain-containing protein [Candidatus Aquicultor sp.]